MSLQSRIARVEQRANPQLAYPYKISVRFLDEDEGRARVEALGLPDHTVVYVTYRDR